MVSFSLKTRMVRRSPCCNGGICAGGFFLRLRLSSEAQALITESAISTATNEYPSYL